MGTRLTTYYTNKNITLSDSSCTYLREKFFFFFYNENLNFIHERAGERPKFGKPSAREKFRRAYSYLGESTDKRGRDSETTRQCFTNVSTRRQTCVVLIRTNRKKKNAKLKVRTPENLPNFTRLHDAKRVR